MAIEAGVMYFDTAHRYGVGASERAIGQLLKGRPRKSFVASTKIVGPRDLRTGLPPQGITPSEYGAEFKRQTEESLERMGLEYVDILFLHGIENRNLLGLSMVKDVMMGLKEEGKTRFLGVSFHHRELEFIPATVEEKIFDVLITSYNFRQPHREKVKEAIAQAANVGLGIITMKTMAGVYWDRERKSPINAKAALKWVRQDENVHTAIPGITTFDQFETDLSVMKDLNLTLQEKRRP